MSLPIHVDESSGHTGNQRPRSFSLDEDLYGIINVIDECTNHRPDIKVQSTECKTYLLKYDGAADEGMLQSGLDGDELLAG